MNRINDGNLCCLPFWNQLMTQPAQPPSGRIAYLMFTLLMQIPLNYYITKNYSSQTTRKPTLNTGCHAS
ncbi:MAG: hypothetical protein LBL62_04660 [Planctomycetaceae bacterium]|nr:hypothetical protein [Planctomycetaceae bacterium]